MAPDRPPRIEWPFLWQAMELEYCSSSGHHQNSAVYAQRNAGQLVALDRSNGKSVANINRSFAQGFHNNVNDRILLYSESECALICLREPDAMFPS